ncbi:glycosyltransferase, MGT family [Beutenbergia cavernae DSM 12333]|uniref:Glycosyltransferase, MGT family n=1 Tax=Beutenbergia cavernae (strain ATCC BAA-8 / DSM 12333 / CCUG 43141 / JCM 11478 / NBRC 16432 / NCIMB 13614 / HKI 0122) TaxID=471853 RepID=C5BZ72_BEUC1|nr:glycosyltransferase [Beutenbergia cavernae]ACQ81187.1 glycosyltransferase, MGT family [Beutenbergia cavernae DSM 12333]
MLDVMVVAMPFTGHVRPMLGLAEELAARGHTVRVHTGGAFAEAVRGSGAEHAAWHSAQDFDETDLAATFPRLVDRRGVRQMAVNVIDLFIGTAPGQSADLIAAWEDRPWDVLVADGLAFGARFAAEQVTAPWVSVGVVPPAWPSRDLPPPGLGLAPGRGSVGRARDAVLRGLGRLAVVPFERAYARARTAAGLGASGIPYPTVAYSRTLSLASGAPALTPPTRDLPPFLEFVGQLSSPGAGAAAQQALPAWWDDVVSAERPVVHVTQGTYNVDVRDLIRPTLDALAERDVLVVVGLAPDAEPPGPLPANARAARMIPYGPLLERTSVVVTNGGWGGVLAALGADVPLVVAGGDLDKPDIAARVARAGAGIDLRTGAPSPAQVDHAVGRVLHEPRFAREAARVGAELRGLGGTRRAVDLVEGLVAGA